MKKTMVMLDSISAVKDFVSIVSAYDYDVDVDSPTAKAGTTYSDWDWVLVRNNGEDWEFKTCGY